jgi:hypothetical protein
METTALVVMEPGSDWPGQIGDSMNVVASSDGGEDLFRRTREKIIALHDSKKAVRVAVLACNFATDGAAVGRRAQLARTLLGAVTCSTFGRFILGASGRASYPFREALLALAGAITEEARGTTVTVSLRFTEASQGQLFRVVQIASEARRRQSSHLSRVPFKM